MQIQTKNQRPPRTARGNVYNFVNNGQIDLKFWQHLTIICMLTASYPDTRICVAFFKKNGVKVVSLVWHKNAHLFFWVWITRFGLKFGFCVHLRYTHSILLYRIHPSKENKAAWGQIGWLLAERWLFLHQTYGNGVDTWRGPAYISANIAGNWLKLSENLTNICRFIASYSDTYICVA